MYNKYILYSEAAKDHFKNKAFEYMINHHIIEVQEDPYDIKLHENVANKVAGQLIKLVNIPRIKKLMSDIFIRMLYDDGFNRNTYKLFKDIISEYLRTDH